MLSPLNETFPIGNGGFRLLTPGNPKTEKGRGQGFWTFILHLAPARLSGFNVCPMATSGCATACLNTAGRGGMMAGHPRLTQAMVAAGITNTIQRARIRKTRAFFNYRAAFMHVLAHDIQRACRLARKAGYSPVFRLNGTSDIRWEAIPVASCGYSYANIMSVFPDVQFYDYTKLPNRRRVPSNYHLTFSLADGNEAHARAALSAGMNVAAVFRDKATITRYIEQGFILFRGDDTDLRFLDPPGHVVALYAKGNARTDTSGFVRD
jgi:hypothetical protein